LTLLEAFVYDPLVDWTVGGENLTVAPSSTSTTAYLAVEEINKINLSFASNHTSSKDLLKMNKINYLQKKPDLELAKQNIIMRFHEIKPLCKEYM